ncbi:hypothetical protein ML313_22435, partial [Escherichia coli]|nr:hypothetical protein [Escherichia coli]
EWVHVQLHQQKGMISLSPPTICNSAHFGDGELESTLTAHAFLDAAGIKLHPANLWYFQEDFPGRKIEYWIIWIYQQTLLFSYENSREVHKTFWK